jgi:hypothetical protein
MLTTILKDNIKCKDILNSQNKKLINFILHVYEDLSSNNDICNVDNVAHLSI